jgi:uncharacterized membrane protein YesL
MTWQPVSVDTGWRHRFAFFAECVIVGLAIAVTGALGVTMPAALAAGAAYLRAWGAGEQATPALFGRVLRYELQRLWAVGVLWVAVTLVAICELVLLTALQVPFAKLVGGALAILGVFAQLIMLRLVSLGELDGNLLDRLRATAVVVVTRPRGTALLFIALALSGVVVWQLPPLMVPALGMLALATASVSAMEGR